MKYVIFANNALEIPVIIPDCANHCDISLGTEFTPVSAGFFSTKGGIVTVFMDQKSTSTGLKPRSDDDILISALIADAGTFYFTKLFNEK